MGMLSAVADSGKAESAMADTVAASISLAVLCMHRILDS